MKTNKQNQRTREIYWLWPTFDTTFSQNAVLHTRFKVDKIQYIDNKSTGSVRGQYVWEMADKEDKEIESISIVSRKCRTSFQLVWWSFCVCSFRAQIFKSQEYCDSVSFLFFLQCSTLAEQIPRWKEKPMLFLSCIRSIFRWNPWEEKRGEKYSIGICVVALLEWSLSIT